MSNILSPISGYTNINHPAFSRKTGIVNKLFILPNEPDDPRVNICIARSCQLRRINPQGTPQQSSGAGYTKQQAFFSAIGEAIERYCSAFYEKDDLILAAYDELEEEGTIPDSFAFYHKRQYEQDAFPYRPFTRKSRIRWTWTFNLTKGKAVLAPATCVYFPYTAKGDEELVWDQVSTGLSCAATLEEAILRGIYEVVERDAFSIMWLNKLSFPRVDFLAHPRIRAVFENYFEIPGCDYYLMEITNDIQIPTIFGVLVDRKGGTAVGAATRFDMVDAVEKTFLELAQSRIAYKRYMVQKHPKDYLPDFSDVNDFIDHSYVYTDISMRSHLEFAWSSQAVKEIEDDKLSRNANVSDALERAIRILQQAGYDVLVANLTTPDVEKFGYHVVRVLIPGLTEITSDHRFPRAGGKRLYELPFRLGYASSTGSFERLNPSPHPFP